MRSFLGEGDLANARDQVLEVGPPLNRINSAENRSLLYPGAAAEIVEEVYQDTVARAEELLFIARHSRWAEFAQETSSLSPKKSSSSSVKTESNRDDERVCETILHYIQRGPLPSSLHEMIRVRELASR